MVSQTSSVHTTASLDADIATLGSALDALHTLARSIPIGVTVPLAQRAEFAAMADKVDSLFEQLAEASAMM